MKIVGGCASDIGRIRKVNQDGIMFRCLRQHGWYFAVGAVCDGIGGLENGEIASAIIIREINSWMQEIENWIDIAVIEAEVIFSHLKDQVEVWNEKLFNYKIINNLQTGTTMSVLMIVRDSYYSIHIGDSRIYLYRDKIKQITVDESCNQIKNGKIKKCLNNYMGKNEKIIFQYSQGKIIEGDMFLLCTDGLYHNLQERDVKKLQGEIKKGKKISESCKGVIKKMIERGETDNISLGIIYVEGAKIFGLKNSMQ